MIVEPKGRIGGAFDNFLKEEGIFEEVQAGARKKATLLTHDELMASLPEERQARINARAAELLREIDSASRAG